MNRVALKSIVTSTKTDKETIEPDENFLEWRS